MKQEASTSVGLIRMILQFASSRGIDSDEICAIAELDRFLLDNIDERVSLERYEAVWKTVIKRSGDRDFGLHFGESIGGHGGGHHLLFYVIMNCPNLGVALDKFCRFHCLLSNEGQPHIEIRGEFGYLTVADFSMGIYWGRHASEALLCSILNFIRHAVPQSVISPVRVSFSHSRPDEVAEHLRIFAAPLLFDQPRNELVLEKKLLELPIFFANPGILQALEQHALTLLDQLYSSDTFADNVVQLIGKMLQGEAPSIETIAKNLAMSTRSLQGKLQQEGTTYQKLLDRVRKEIAVSYLKQSDVAIIDIAFLLGFSEQSAFNHAFKRWTGMTPHQHRQQVK